MKGAVGKNGRMIIVSYEIEGRGKGVGRRLRGMGMWCRMEIGAKAVVFVSSPAIR